MIRALVAVRAEELVQEVPVGVMDLDNIESCFDSALGPGCECFHQFLNFGNRQRSWRSVDFVPCDCGWCNNVIGPPAYGIGS